MQTVLKAVPALLRGAKSAKNLRRASTTFKKQKSVKGRIKPVYDTYKGVKGVASAIQDLDDIYAERHDRSRSGQYSDYRGDPRETRRSRRDDGYYDRRRDTGYHQPSAYGSKRQSRVYPAEDEYVPPRRARTAYATPPQYYYRATRREYVPRASTWADTRYH